MTFKLYCLDVIDLKLSQLIQPAAKGRRNDEMIRLGVWHIPYSFRDVQGLLLASAHNTEYKAPSSDRQAAEYLLMKDDFENSWAPHTGFEPPPSVQQAGTLTTRPLSCLSAVPT